MNQLATPSQAVVVQLLVLIFVLPELNNLLKTKDINSLPNKEGLG